MHVVVAAAVMMIDNAAWLVMIRSARCRCMSSVTYPNEKSHPASVCAATLSISHYHHHHQQHHPSPPCARLPSIITVACA